MFGYLARLDIVNRHFRLELHEVVSERRILSMAIYYAAFMALKLIYRGANICRLDMSELATLFSEEINPALLKYLDIVQIIT